MAEGDTIHRLAARLGAALVGEEVVEATVPSPRSPLRLAPERVERLEGSCIEKVEARGKHLLIGFDCGLTLHSHLGMKGKWELRRSGESDPLPRSAWVVLETRACAASQIGGPRLALLSGTELRRERQLSKLGPDLLADGFDPRAGAERLRGMGRDRELGDALLDQRILAGIGNVLKSEGCFATKTDPFSPVGSFSVDQLERLLALERELMRRSVQTGRREQRIYGAAGRPCPRCGTAISSAVQGDAARRTYWCRRCQPPPATEAGSGA